MARTRAANVGEICAHPSAGISKGHSMTSVVSPGPTVKPGRRCQRRARRAGRPPRAGARCLADVRPRAHATRSGRPASRRTGGRSASSCITSPASTRLEIQLAQTPGRRPPGDGPVTWDDVHAGNSAQAPGARTVTKEAALELLRRNSAGRRGGASAPSPDEELDEAAPASLYANAPIHLPVHARGSRRAAQLSPPRPHIARRRSASRRRGLKKGFRP
jgi:hypothetical protein